MSGYYLLKNGEFAYNKSYSVGYDFGSIKRLDRYPMGALSTLYICFALKKYNSDFIRTYFDSLKWYKEIYMISAEGARNHGLLNVPTDDFLETQHFLTENADEQEKIARFMTLLESRIDAQQQLVESLKKYKRGLLSAIFDRRIRFKADDGSEFPNWMSVTLQDVAEAFEYGMNAAATDFDGKHKYIRITDIDDSSHRYIDNNPVSPSGDISAKYKVAEDDILFARTGASVGKSYLYDTDDGDLYFAGFLIRAHVRPEYNSYFVYINTLSYNYAKWVALESMRSGQPGINAEQYKEYSFPCPSLDEQRKIARFVMRIDKKIRTEEMKLEKFHSCKTGLLQQLFI